MERKVIDSAISYKHALRGDDIDFAFEHLKGGGVSTYVALVKLKEGIRERSLYPPEIIMKLAREGISYGTKKERENCGKVLRAIAEHDPEMIELEIPNLIEKVINADPIEKAITTRVLDHYFKYHIPEYALPYLAYYFPSGHQQVDIMGGSALTGWATNLNREMTPEERQALHQIEQNLDNIQEISKVPTAELLTMASQSTQIKNYEVKEAITRMANRLKEFRWNTVMEQGRAQGRKEIQKRKERKSLFKRFIHKIIK